MGAEETFSRDTADPEVISRELLRLARQGDLADARGGPGRADGRDPDPVQRLQTITRSRTLPDPTDVTTVVHAEAVGLFEVLGAQRRGGSGWSGSGSRASRPRAGASASWSWGSGSAAGRRPIAPWTGPDAGSAAARCGRRRCSAERSGPDGRREARSRDL